MDKFEQVIMWIVVGAVCFALFVIGFALFSTFFVDITVKYSDISCDDLRECVLLHYQCIIYEQTETYPWGSSYTYTQKMNMVDQKQYYKDKCLELE